jgi:hypothetical protein
VNVTSSSTPAPIQTLSISSSIDAIQFLGAGDDVKSFTVTGTGLKIFSMSYSGNQNFNIRLLDSEGNLVELLANEVGSYNGEKTVKLDAGKYTLYINTTGPWWLDIS